MQAQLEITENETETKLKFLRQDNSAERRQILFEQYRQKDRSGKNIKLTLWFLAFLNLAAAFWFVKINGAGFTKDLFMPKTKNTPLVSGLVQLPGSRAILIKGQIATVGDTVDGYKILDISKDMVQLEYHGQKIKSSF